MKIAYCQSTFRDDFDDTMLCIERVSPHVDFTVIAYDGSLTDRQIQWLMVNSEKFNLHPVRFKWEDDMPKMRNSYLEEAKRLGAEWAVVSDPDELFSEELAKNLRQLIESHDMQGFNLLPIHARDQFEDVEFLDDLDLLKETPGGYRETSFWKPLLCFKVYPDLHYEGVGAEGKVHEVLKSSAAWNHQNLPKEFYYTHRKSALRIWRNAARNMFIGGGGDNVGQLNRYWTKLRLIMPTIGVFGWNDFESFIKEGNAPEEFKEWLLDALQAPPTNWGTETRQVAKWYYALHREEVTPEVMEAIENPPAMTREIEVENYVTRCYFEVLGRHPDEAGRQRYANLILEGTLPRENLPMVLKQSAEYRGIVGAGSVERVKMTVPVDVNVHISEGLFIEALKRSATYWDVIKPKIDLGGFILAGLRRKKELLEWFYQHQDQISIHDVAVWLLENAPKQDSVALCIMGFSKGLPLIYETIHIVEPLGVFDEIHVQGDDFTEEDIKLLESYGAQVHTEPWVDDFSGYKNKAIAPANTEWVLILDHDEIPTLDLAENLKGIIERSNHGKKYNMVQFDAIDVWTMDGDPISEHRTTSGKGVLHWNVPDAYYGNPHIWLKPNFYPWKMVHADHAYRHVKEQDTVLPNSVRNVFLGGGGDNTREDNPNWVELRKVTKELEVDTWAKFHEYLKAGQANHKLLMVLKELADMTWKDDELKDPLRYYFLLHPEEDEEFQDKVAENLKRLGYMG